MRKKTEELWKEAGGNSLTDYGVEWLETFRRLVIENERECAEAVAIVNSTLYGVAFCETAGTLIPYGTKLFTFPPAAQVPGWQPIETAPRDNKAPLLLAQFNEDGTLQSFDYNGSWASDRESWEIPQVYYYWETEKGNVEEPTHWMYQPDWFAMLAAAPEVKQ